MLPQRATVEQLAQRLSYSASPLGSEQAEALIDLMVEVGGEVRSASPGVSLVVNPDTPQAVPIVQGLESSSQITDDLLSKAPQVLDPPQVVAFQQLRFEQGAAETEVSLARAHLSPTGGSSLPYPISGLEFRWLLQ